MQEANKEMLTVFCTVSPATPQWSTADAEVKMPSVENQELTLLFPFKAWSRSEYS